MPHIYIIKDKNIYNIIKKVYNNNESFKKL